MIIPLGWALLHFLWQGALIALLLAAVNLLLQRANARLRYAVDCLALVLMLAAVVSTFIWLSPRSTSEASRTRWHELKFQAVAPSVAEATPAISIDSPLRWKAWLDSHLTWLVCAWFAGVVILSLRITGGWIFAQTLKRRAWPVGPHWQETLTRLTIRFDMRRRIALCESVGARVPAVIGWLRPVILLPMSAMAGLSPQMIEVVLAHELAHIRRHDYLVNLLQTAVETLLFYHLAVWWVGKKIREERENCCDDLAVAACGDRVIYARALTALEDLRSTPPRLAVAATAGSLLTRIRRLVQVREPAGSPSIAWLAGVIALLTLGALWAARPASVAYGGRGATSYAAIRPALFAQTTSPESKSTELATQATLPGSPSAPRSSLPATSPAKSSPDEMTPGQMFRKATRDGDLQTIETLLSLGFDPNAPVDGHGFKPLWYAISSGNADVVELLLAAHADPNAKPANSPPFYAVPLRLALQSGNLRMAEDLVLSGASVDARGSDGRTALYYEVTHGHLDAIQCLVDRGADVNVRDAGGDSLLDDAVWTGQVDTVALLLAHGSRLNEPQTQTGATPINEAACRGYSPLVQYLLQFHPDLGIPDKRGYTPLENALRFGREEVALILLEADTKALQPLGNLIDAAIRKDEPRITEALLQRGVSVNGTLPSGSTPLQAAMLAGASKAVQVLLDNGADPNLGSPLEDAALKGYDSIVSLLVDHGALVNRADSESGATALYAAASFGKAAVVKLLLSRGANPNLCGRNHKSPYQVALDNGFDEVATDIKQHGGGNSCQP